MGYWLRVLVKVNGDSMDGNFVLGCSMIVRVFVFLAEGVGVVSKGLLLLVAKTVYYFFSLF